MPYNFKDTELPDHPEYRKAFEKGLKALLNSTHPSTADETQKSYHHISVLPAQIVCQLGLPKKKEACLVKTLLNGHSAFTQIASCEVRKLQEALILGFDALSPDTHKLENAAKKMSPDERLMTQLSIYTMVQDAYDAAQKSESGDTLATICDHAAGLLRAYETVTRHDFPLVDSIVQNRMSFITEKSAAHPRSHASSVKKTPRHEKGFF